LQRVVHFNFDTAMNEMLKLSEIQNRIYLIRGKQVMLDRDLAEMYGVETRRLNEQVKRNIARFPVEFMFQLANEEFENWMSQIAISNKDRMGVRKRPSICQIDLNSCVSDKHGLNFTAMKYYLAIYLIRIIFIFTFIGFIK
jgi:ORF6N domain